MQGESACGETPQGHACAWLVLCTCMYRCVPASQEKISRDQTVNALRAKVRMLESHWRILNKEGQMLGVFFKDV